MVATALSNPMLHTASTGMHPYPEKVVEVEFVGSEPNLVAQQMNSFNALELAACKTQVMHPVGQSGGH